MTSRPQIMKKVQTLREASKKFIAFLLLSCIAFPAFSAEVVKKEQALYTNPMFIILAVLVVLLAIVIVTYTEVIKAAVHIRIEKNKKEAEGGTVIKAVALLLVVFAASQQAYAAEAVTSGPENYFGMDGFTFYLMVGVLAFESLVIGVLYLISMNVLKEKKVALASVAEKAAKKPSLIEKLNASVAVEQEADIMLDHNYDGIRELDNDLPPWWKYGFYLTILVGIIYMAHYHIAGTGKLQLAEYNQQLADARIAMDAYRKKAANQVDENNASALLDNGSLTAGKLIYKSSCSACHGAAGEGGVGPNLTDDYWLHKGSIKDIFRSVKYGWPEKGMKSWQQDLSARQIHEVSSYIKSLKGSQPANPKKQQGELFIEETEAPSGKVETKDSSLVQK